MAFFAAEYTQELSEVIREIETDPATYKGAEYMPAVNVPTAQVFVDVWKARGGMTKEHTKGTDPQSVQRRSFYTQQFAPGAYKEFIRFNEMDILYLRELGQNDQSKRGIEEHMNANILMLNNRLEARMELLRWQAMLNGTYVYDGKVVDFGRPANHDVSPMVPWGSSANGIFTNVNTSADPMADLRYWLQGGFGPFRKYKVRKIVMNPNTARMFMLNPKVQQFIMYSFASAANRPNTVQGVLEVAVPGLPPVEIYEGAYMPEAMDPVTGEITTGDSVYFIPDGRIFFEPILPDGNKFGDVAMTLNLANGDYKNPQAGKFLIVDDKLAERPGNPYIDIFSGFYGGPRLKRGFDMLSATVI